MFYRIAAVILCITLITPAQAVATETESTSPLYLSEIKVRNDAGGYDEFLELYNSGDEPVALWEYSLAYYNSPTPTADQLPTKISEAGEGWLEPGNYYVLAKKPEQILDASQSPFTSLADSGGHIKLLANTGTLIDEIAWASTSSVAIPPIIHISATSASNTKSIQRVFAEDSADTAWILTSPTTPISSLLTEPEWDLEEAGMGSVTLCGLTIISEVLPNPSGSDASQEYIEIHNPTADSINLAGCGLQTTSSSKIYWFDDRQILPGEYLALYDEETGLILPNSAGGSVYLLSSTLEELHTATYPANLADNIAWAWFGNNEWEVTFSPTPNEANVSMPELPCPAGQERNPETNRCRSVNVSVSNTGPAACKAGQERNPATNRCRNIITAATALAPCKPNQSRNPETNRCRNIVTTNIKPCPEGQERNETTNRCRKILASASNMAVQDVAATTSALPGSWWLAIGGIAGALGYGVWEWRYDLRSWLTRLRQRK